MFGFIKNLFRKPAEALPASTPNAPTNATAVTEPMGTTPSMVVGGGNGTHQAFRGLELPLPAVINSLPAELQARIKACPEDQKISVPLDKILSQLARGVVKISFGDLRRCASEFFSAGADRDAIPVVLPLAEIISRLNPALITRRRTQKQVHVPADIGSPFDAKGRGLSVSVAPAKLEPTAAIRPGPVQLQSLSVPASGSAFAPRANLETGPAPVLPGMLPSLPTATGFRLPSGPPELVPGSPGFLPISPVAASEPLRPPLVISASALAETWPQAIRHELFQFNLLDAKIALPFDAIEQALQRGKILFPWKSLRSWMTSTPLPAVSPHDNQVLELPLKVIAPLFLTARQQAGQRHKISVDENIPNLFFTRPQGETLPIPPAAPAVPASAPVAKSADTNFYPAEDLSGKARAAEQSTKVEHTQGPTTPGTSFVARYASPNEVVSRAAALDGVAGALIALPDGLMVASHLSSDLNGDTLAAFLPQIMGRVSQCTKELRMGELNNLNFTVGLVPWKIFRVNAIFFAAFGRSGEPLPTAQLASLAAELDRKHK
jgi:hypothetical protein